MRIVVTGTEGQVVRSLAERAEAAGATIVAVGRPDLDLARPETVAPALRAARPDVIVNAAAYTAVDQAEAEPDLAEAINGAAAGAVAACAAGLGVPVIQISTDYVFAGDLDRPYRESDGTGPVSAYGGSKHSGERQVAAATPNHAILRTAWVYSPFGKNFVKTMLRVAAGRDELSVVADQHGSPTSALDIADGVIHVARNLLARPGDATLRGVFHMTGAGETTWADFAEAIFAASERLGGPHARVNRIPTSAYPTPARRPANSRLDGTRLAETHGLRLPPWRDSLQTCVERLIRDESWKG